MTVITCVDEMARPCGITANSFSSVSLDPPLILWNIAKVSNSLQAFLDAEHFAINVLTDAQESLARHFAKSDHTLFDNIDYSLSEFGVPILPHMLAYFECRKYQVYDAGDHHIVIGEVERFNYNSGEPLLFFNGAYTRLNS